MKSVTRPSTPRRLVRTVLLGAAFGVVMFASQAGPAASSAMNGDDVSRPDAVAGFRPETRLRKLHLVRPDLIPYPIAYEVYC
jgi:hypothetical protein